MLPMPPQSRGHATRPGRGGRTDVRWGSARREGGTIINCSVTGAIGATARRPSWPRGSAEVAIDTRRVAGRQKLRFADLDEMLAYAERLVSGGSTQLGNWSLGQVLQHLALIQV